MKNVLLSLSVALAATVGCGSDNDETNDDGTGGSNGDGDTGGSSGDGDNTGGMSGDGDTGGTGGTGGTDATGGMGGDGPMKEVKYFNRVSSYLVCSLQDDTCDDDTETAAEIVAATPDGNTLVYSDSPLGAIGYVDITDPKAPAGIKTVDVGGEPTSVATKGDFVLVGVVDETSTFTAPAGALKIYNSDTKSDTAVRTIDVGGQPDSVAVSPDGNYAALVIENERDEDFTPATLEEGDIPQLPAGKLVVFDISDADPANWTSQDVDLTGLTGAVAPTDPEPEYVDINSANKAVVTLQENNAIAIVDLATAAVDASFSAGDVDLDKIDNNEEDIILMNQSLTDVPREPDGVSWIDDTYFATADEGDWKGGSRGFTVFNATGDVQWTAGNTMDHMTARFGHYPDGRSENKGNEPENIEYATFGDENLLFVNSERSSLVFVYDVEDPTDPVFKQVLPAAAAPEGGLAIPSRNLLIVASEEDSRGDKLRSALNIYEYGADTMSYPTLVSVDRDDDTPIAWAAMSGLAADPTDANILYAVEDSAFDASRIFVIDTTDSPALITEEIRIVDTNDVFAGVTVESGGDDDDEFQASDLAAMINGDKTVNIDPEGISAATGGGWWVVSEGNGTFGLQEDPEELGVDQRPINSRNMLFKISATGVIEDVVFLPEALNDVQLRFGFEGVAEYNGKAFVAFQREWDDEANVRIGIYDVTGKTWEFVNLALDTPDSQNGGWTGLSDITSLGGGKFLLLERDNQGGPDASIKKLYTIDLSSYTDGDTVTKTLVLDLMPELAKTGGLTYEKIEGTAVDSSGDVWIINDNDGVDDNSGETQLINLGDILP